MSQAKTPAKKRAVKPVAPAAFVADRAPRLYQDPRDDRDTTAQKTARQLLSPAMAAVRAINAAERDTQWGAALDAQGAMDELRRIADQVKAGDMSRPERMLITQAVTLENLFVRLTERAMAQSGLPQFEAFMRLGLKAQAQSRLAIEALASLKHGPIMLARGQFNMANGPQQVNNGPSPRVANSENAPNRLSGAHELHSDCGAQGRATRSDPAMAALEEVNGTENR
jgi:hypothetical protein